MNRLLLINESKLATFEVACSRAAFGARQPCDALAAIAFAAAVDAQDAVHAAHAAIDKAVPA
jgi:hypothetical protein